MVNGDGGGSLARFGMRPLGHVCDPDQLVRHPIRVVLMPVHQDAEPFQRDALSARAGEDGGRGRVRRRRRPGHADAGAASEQQRGGATSPLEETAIRIRNTEPFKG